MISRFDLQYCAKEMRANFEKIRLLFLRILDEISSDTPRNFADMVAKIRKLYQNFEQGVFEFTKFENSVLLNSSLPLMTLKNQAINQCIFLVSEAQTLKDQLR